MNVVEIIRKKRDKFSLTEEEIQFMVSSYTKQKLPDYQFSAFLMAGYINGFSKEETSYLTKAMLYSGKIIDLSAIESIKVDKHSTGGVGDKTSLILAPIVACTGICVPMISGRGLGHTGGTLDKLESIPGFRTNLNLREYKKQLQKIGAVLIGQTQEIAPADKTIYSLRDVTATVESIPLITGSIMSKKLAEGIDGLVLDVKTGSGAFMKKYEDAITLAEALINAAKSFDKKVIAFITDMNQPLGNYIGNWLEVYECVKVLKNEVENDLSSLSLSLAGAMIYLGKKAGSIEEGTEMAAEIVKSGKAFDKFSEIVRHQGGNVKFINDPETYPNAKYYDSVKLETEGYISEIDNYELGMAALELGAGRKVKEDKIDPTAGIVFYAKLGEKFDKTKIAAELYSSSRKRNEKAKERILNAVKVSKTKPVKQQLIKKIIE
jgi:pyrimidine-nucleoside phosphorylase